MQLQTKAGLTVEQRQEVQRLHANGASIRWLARRFEVNPTTIQRWVKRKSPLDHTSAPVSRPTVITPEYRAAVVKYRKAHPEHGPAPIASALVGEFPKANRGTVLRILQEEGLTRSPRHQEGAGKSRRGRRHRLQVDIHRLPAAEESQAPQVKITVVHRGTRLKYFEVCRDQRPQTVAGVLRRALGYVPAFASSGSEPRSNPA